MKLGIICSDGFELTEIKSACITNGVEYEVIDFKNPDWFKSCENLDGYLVRPPCQYQEHKTIFDERIYLLNKVLKKKVYPSFEELYVYESKRNMALFMQAYQLPHVKTKVYMDYNTLKAELCEFTYPVVVKSNIGAGSSGVRILSKESELKKIGRKIFNRINPLLSKGFAPTKKYKGIQIPLHGVAQKHFLIIQDFIKLKVEWRMIRIGNSYFGHQKLIGQNGMASGSLLVGWEKPPLKLLELLHNATEAMSMDCMVLDIFEDINGKYYINEMQTIIGAILPYQMKVDGKPGRYKRVDDEFIFEPGEHCTNKCWDLRVAHFIEKLKGEQGE